MKAQNKPIKAEVLKPQVTYDDIDVYLERGKKALDQANQSPRGLFRIFQRHEGARFFGLREYLAACASMMSAQDIVDTIVYAVPEGQALKRHATALTVEGPGANLMFNETLLHFLSTGTRFRTLSASYPADRFPWVFMGARYLASDDLAIATRALSEEGILSTTKRWADKYIGTESHSQIVMWAGLQLEQQVETAIAAETDNEMVAATIRATVAFHLANPEVPLYVLGDFAARTVGCFETFRATAAVCASLGITLVGGRMDISKADLDDQPIVDAMYIKWVSKKNLLLPEGFPDHLEMKAKPGMSPELVQITRKQLRKAGLKNFNLVVSSGIKLQDIDAYVEAGANIVGIGEEAAYYLNKGECNYTSDAIGYFEGERFVPFAKEGRELSRLVGSESVANATRGYKIAGNLVRYNLADFV